MIRLFIIFFCYAIFGCLTTGAKLTDEQKSKVRLNRSTFDEVLSVLGEPHQESEGTQNGAFPKTCGKTGSLMKSLMYVFSTPTASLGRKSEIYMYYFNESKILCHLTTNKVNQTAF